MASLIRLCLGWCAGRLSTVNGNAAPTFLIASRRNLFEYVQGNGLRHTYKMAWPAKNHCLDCARCLVDLGQPRDRQIRLISHRVPNYKEKELFCLSLIFRCGDDGRLFLIWPLVRSVTIKLINARYFRSAMNVSGSKASRLKSNQIRLNAINTIPNDYIRFWRCERQWMLGLHGIDRRQKRTQW